MADVVRLLPRLWDGQRALRFLAGLAMLALGFAANAGLIGPAALPSAPAPVTAASFSSPAVPDPSAASVSAGSVSGGSVSATMAASVPAASDSAASDSVASASVAAEAASPVAVDDVVVAVTPLGFAAVLGLLVVLVSPVGRRGAGRAAGGAPVQRGPPLR